MKTLRRMAGALIGALMLATGAHAQEIVQTPIAGFPHAKVWRQADETARPVVVILHGADGNDEAGERFGPILARLGYAAVGLPYYSPNWGDFGPPPKFPDLPGSFIDIRVDQMADLRDALRGMDGVDIERFGLFGASKGAEFALIAASRYPWIDSVVAYAPTDVVWEGWGLEMLEAEGTRSSFAFGGEPLPFMPYRGFVEGLLAGPTADLRAIHDNGRADHPDKEAGARIPVETYPGELMLIAGGKDAQWNATRAAINIQRARNEAGLPTELLGYPEAGHDLVGDGGPRDSPRSGGSPDADAAARADAWPKVVAFLARTLTP
ncbi:MAG: dienelactone hydrolase [Brevundimonas sp.]|uniref:dienelactone hydrolase family protein n=1 Tax=Brevundimonas sp. TaxID=1871086 RepID=UPI0011F69B7E|nr:acyl-CoA thioester hydrolase/BAAT C-terminal domain-containing protein [Brevundimonas sp.]RZJ17083.1 MAG: dienelactone hydrolase [Brevundimonas sp.]